MSGERNTQQHGPHGPFEGCPCREMMEEMTAGGKWGDCAQMMSRMMEMCRPVPSEETTTDKKTTA